LLTIILSAPENFLHKLVSSQSHGKEAHFQINPHLLD
jgi:hypothetical protein